MTLRVNAAWPTILTFLRIAGGCSSLKWKIRASLSLAVWFLSRAVQDVHVVGPPDSMCTSGAWSPDGKWVYLTVKESDKFHIWRQRFPNGQPEQVTSGTTEEEGIAMAPDGKSFITSVGTHDSMVWIHDQSGEHPISSQGEAGRLAVQGSARISKTEISIFFI